MPQPSLSLIIPCLNPPPDFYSTVEELNRNYGEEIEIIISNGGGLDTSKLPKVKNLRHWSDPDTGQAQAINKGIRRSTGDLVGYLNVDDLLIRNAIRLVKEAFACNPDVDVIYGEGIHIDQEGNWLEDYPTRPWDYSLLRTECFLCQPAVFWRKKIHDEFGYFNEDLHFALDYEFWLRLGKRLSFHYLEYEYLAKSRLHPIAKTVQFPLKAKWENLLVKQKHNQWIDTKSAFEYCTLLVNEKLDERNNPRQFAKELLTAMAIIEAQFTIQDIHSWETGRIQMQEMERASTRLASDLKKLPTILVNISLFQPGGVHGGIKPAIYSLLKEITNINKCKLILVIAEQNKAEIQETFGSSVNTIVGDQNTDVEQLKKNNNIDVVFCPLPSLKFHHPEIPLIFLAPDLLHLDYPASLTEPDREHRNNLFLQAKEKADIFLTVSKFSRDRLLMAYKIPHRKVWVLPHALPENRAKPRIQNNQKTSPHFLYPANFWEHKNHKTLFVAYKSYLRQSKSPWKLVLTGHPESGNSKEIIELLETLNLTNFVEFKGFLNIEEYGEVLSNTGALVFPSNYEGFCLPLLEAMEWNIPIIAADLPSLREVAESAAYYIDQQSPEAISKALLKINNDPELRENLVGEGRKRLRDFNWRQPAETFINLATNLVAKRMSPAP